MEPGAPPSPTPTPASWRHHLADEADAAYLYRRLAAAEGDAKKAETYLKLAAVEDRHVDTWKRLLVENGYPVPTTRPSLRARTLAWLARSFGSAVILPMLVREEGREVKGYLQLHRGAPRGPAGPAALLLARESAEHAESLSGLAGREGEPWHRAGVGGILRNVVYGFNDGLTANFGLVAGILGAREAFDVSGHAVLVAGIAGLVADALSMGSSGYLAAKSEREVHEHEIALEREELLLMPEAEREELSLLYQAKGFPESQALELANRVLDDPERALAEKVREELGIGEPSTTPLREAWITGVSTAFGAFIPVAPFLVSGGSWAIWTSFTVSMLSHFAVGAARSLFTGRGIFRSGADMFVVGLGVAALGYVVGDLLTKLL